MKAPAQSAPKAFASKAKWAAWLAANHAKSNGVGLLMMKKGATTRKRSVTYAEAVEVALAWGWIDGKKQALDESSWIQRFSPRTKTSLWSKINRDKALALIAANSMETPGLEEVDRAKRDGRWDAAYDSPRTSTLPDDLAAALTANPRAAAFFETIDRANRYSILHRVQTARKPETRAARIAKLVAMLGRHELLHASKRS
jgi:uncharacterized protein YdeI (YjbR/CyaY-like superfamily)